jgi:hypothetical protein
MFVYLGVALVVLAVVTFPARVMLHAQAADSDYYGVGWLFAPIIGVWGLASLVLGLVQSSQPKSKVEAYLLPISVVLFVGFAFAAFMAAVYGVGIVRSVGHGEPFWLIYFGFVLGPSLIAGASTYKYLKSKEKENRLLLDKKVRAVTFVLLAAVPLLYSTFLLNYLNLL